MPSAQCDCRPKVESNRALRLTESASHSMRMSTFSSPVSDGATLPSGTQFYSPLNVNWSVGETSGSCTATACATAGASSNPVYVTLGPSVLPSSAGAVMLTYVALAVGSGGASSQASALANTWSYFSTSTGPASVKTWDGRSMYYYSAGFGARALTATNVVQNLPTPSAQCGAFALLIESALAMNGIHSNWIQITATDGSTMVVKNWNLSSSPAYANAPPWIYQMLLGSRDAMSPALSSYGDLGNLSGIPGQNPGTPVEKVFANHFIVRVPIAQGNQYYDPSYGVTYSGPAGFESQAITGYAKYLGDPGQTYRVKVPVSESPNITFTPDATFLCELETENA
jgi:hypothetical protein